MAFCSRCGTQINNGAAFCSNCGSQIEEATNLTPPTQGGSLNELDHLARDRYAQEHWFYRLIAFVIDALMVGVGLSLLVFLAALATGHPAMTLAFEISVLPTFGAIGGGVILFLYFVISESVYGTSIGKNIFHLRVVNVDGTKADPAKIAIRNVSKIYFVLLVLDILAGLISHSRRGQKFSDYIGGTNVITTSQEIGFLRFRTRAPAQT
jgi:uncharacterized RDD family membrane protein YckC